MTNKKKEILPVLETHLTHLEPLAGPVISIPCLKAQDAPAATDLLLPPRCHRQWDTSR